MRYINKFCFAFNIFVGADVKINEQGKLEVTNVLDYTDEYYSCVKKGDIILEVNGEKGSDIQLKSGRLVNVESLIVERDNKYFIYSINKKYTK